MRPRRRWSEARPQASKWHEGGEEVRDGHPHSAIDDLGGAGQPIDRPGDDHRTRAERLDLARASLHRHRAVAPRRAHRRRSNPVHAGPPRPRRPRTSAIWAGAASQLRRSENTRPFSLAGTDAPVSRPSGPSHPSAGHGGARSGMPRPRRPRPPPSRGERGDECRADRGVHHGPGQGGEVSRRRRCAAASGRSRRVVGPSRPDRARG